MYRFDPARTSAGAIAILLAATLAAPRVARALPACQASMTYAVRQGATAWPSPLDRKVSLRVRELTLRDALDSLAAAAGIRFSYASELVPLDLRVCAGFLRVAVGDALLRLLRDLDVEPVVAGAEQVVLTRARSQTIATGTTVAVPIRTTDLARVTVTGDQLDGSRNLSSISHDVISGRDLALRNAGSLGEALNGAVPGVWIWERSPSTLATSYGSVRGASSFGVSAPKIYIDGIEVANPLLLSQLTTDQVERVEVIRGPQGSALFGADAMGGVINIVSRHDGLGLAGERLSLRSEAGLSGSSFAPYGVRTQDYTLSARSGSTTRTAGLGIAYNTFGEFVPGASSRQLAASADARIIGARTSVIATARYFTQQAGVPESAIWSRPMTQPVEPPGRPPTDRSGPEPSPSANDLRGGQAPLAPGSVAAQPVAIDSTTPESARQYTLGTTASFAPNSRWTHSLVVGIDGYQLSNVAYSSGGPIPTPVDSALRNARGRADRTTLRLSSVAMLAPGATVTFSADHSALREETAGEALVSPFAATSAARSVAWRSSSGASALASLAVAPGVLFTGGLRLERDAGYTTSSLVNLLPMLGASYTRALGIATLGLRSAYGRGIRPFALESIRNGGRFGSSPVFAPIDLAPEVQSGVEAGADLSFGRALAFHVTRFDQRASGLIQPVAVSSPNARDPRHPLVAYVLQNVGEIGNRGWEMQSAVTAGRLSLAGTLSLVDSRVQQLAKGYAGDLLVGDRMLAVPARTASLTASWKSAAWSTSWTLARASDWINYDRAAISQDLLSTTLPTGSQLGAWLRSYWMDYAGLNRLRATASRDLFHGLSLVFTGENLLGQQVGEPDNLTIVPGRTLLFGVRAKF